MRFGHRQMDAKYHKNSMWRSLGTSDFTKHWELEFRPPNFNSGYENWSLNPSFRPGVPQETFWMLDFCFWILDLGSWILDLGSWIVDCELWIVNCELWIVNCELWFMNCELWFMNCEFWVVNYELWIMDYESLSVSMINWFIEQLIN